MSDGTYLSAFRDYFRSRSGYFPPDSVQPPAYGAGLWNSGVRPNLVWKDTEVPEWAQTEAYGRSVQDRFASDGALTGQIGGTWPAFLASVIRGPGIQFLARLIAARGPLMLREQVKWIARGARNFPNDMDRIIDSLPTGSSSQPEPVRSVTVEFASGRRETLTGE